MSDKVILAIVNLICTAFVIWFSADLSCYMDGGRKISTDLEVVNTGRGRSNHIMSVADSNSVRYWGIGSLSYTWAYSTTEKRPAELTYLPVTKMALRIETPVDERLAKMNIGGFSPSKTIVVYYYSDFIVGWVIIIYIVFLVYAFKYVLHHFFI